MSHELLRHNRLRGVRLARRALELSHPAAESPQESRLRLVLTDAGLDPVPQYVVQDAFGAFLARVDLALPAARVAIEYDGRDAHLSPEAFIRDRQRQNLLIAAGWTVLRFTAVDLWHPGDVVRAVQAAVRALAA